MMRGKMAFPRLLAVLALTSCAATDAPGFIAGFPASVPRMAISSKAISTSRMVMEQRRQGSESPMHAPLYMADCHSKELTLCRRNLLFGSLAAALLTSHVVAGTADPEPAPGSRAYLRITLKLVADNQLSEAEERLTKSIEAWNKECPLELAVLYKYRGDVRTNQGQLANAIKDYSLSIAELKRSEESDIPENVVVDGTLCLQETGDPEKQFCIYVPAQSDLYLRRGRVCMLLKDYAAAEESLTRVLAIAEEEGTRNPWALLYRGDAKMGAGVYGGAMADYAEAQKEFKNIGDAVTAEVARAGKALALYGQGKVEDAVATMSDVVLRTPSVTGDLELLLSLSDKEAEMHAALAAHYWSVGQASVAEGEWDKACVRMDAMNDYAAKRIAASPFDKKGADGQVIKAYLPTNVVGCKRYRDRDYLVGAKMWPPVLVENMASFFTKK